MSTSATLFLVIIGSYYAHSQDPTEVETEYGPIKGFLIPHQGVRIFRSIPYAAAPTGELRWSNPQPPEPWTKTLDCTQEVVGCPQSCHQIPLDCTECPDKQSEDCLFVNVWSPLSSTPTSNLPVLLFIHGGSFWTGYGGGLLYNGTRMVNETGKIVVTINYRLGALGSLYDSSMGLQGNYGYLDQVFAIEWAYRNIKNFGGNPDRITIFGESAGAHSVALHLLNTTSLISGGIMESPPVGLPLRSVISWGTLPQTFSNELGCNTKTMSPIERLKCLRSKNASQIVIVQKTSNDNDPQTGYNLIKTGMPWTPTVGPGTIIVDQPLVAFQNGQYNKKIPFMGGTNKGESFMFTAPVVTYNDMKNTLIDNFGTSDANKILGFYNVTNGDRDENLVEIAGNILTDYMFRCPTRNMMASSVQHAPTKDNIGYFYHFNYIASYAKHVWYYKPACWTHVCHTEELPAVFNPNSSSIDVYPTPQEILGANQIQFAWTNFAETGNPATGKHANDLWTKWTNYASNTLQQTLMINNVSASNGVLMVNTPDQSICVFWDGLNYDWMNGTNSD